MKKCRFLVAVLLLCFVVTWTGACDVDDDDANDVAVDDDDDDNDDATIGDDDDDNDDNDNDDNDDDNNDTPDTFPPDQQTPFFEKGMILPRNSLECIPEDTGIPQLNCNHHGSIVAELPDGTMAAVWYHGVAEKSRDSRIVWSTFDAEADEWSWPEVLFDDPGRSEGNPALWVSEEGELLVFFVTIMGENWDDSNVRLVRSANNGATWSDPVTLRERWCWMTRARPQRLANGELLLPLYSECLAYPVYMRSADNFATWQEEALLSSDYFFGHLGQIQPSLVALDDGVVAAITRDGLPTHRIKRTVSEDFGVTWTPSRSTELPNSGTGIDQIRLLDGHVVVVFNNSPTERFPLAAALSHDGGETFVALGNLDDQCDEETCNYSYPSVIQNCHDGTIWVTYTQDNRSTIGYAHFNEAWLLEGTEQPNHGETK